MATSWDNVTYLLQLHCHGIINNASLAAGIQILEAPLQQEVESDESVRLLSRAMYQYNHHAKSVRGQCHCHAKNMRRWNQFPCPFALS